MRSLFVIAAALAGLTTISAVPAVAANHVGTLKLNPSFHRTQQYCAPPKHLENICVAYGPGAPGSFAGPCIKYQIACVTSVQIH
jgi:hypothetical protein